MIKDEKGATRYQNPLHFFQQPIGIRGNSQNMRENNVIERLIAKDELFTIHLQEDRVVRVIAQSVIKHGLRNVDPDNGMLSVIAQVRSRSNTYFEKSSRGVRVYFADQISLLWLQEDVNDWIHKRDPVVK